jgi:hypothetical protein
MAWLCRIGNSGAYSCMKMLTSRSVVIRPGTSSFVGTTSGFTVRYAEMASSVNAGIPLSESFWFKESVSCERCINNAVPQRTKHGSKTRCTKQQSFRLPVLHNRRLYGIECFAVVQRVFRRVGRGYRCRVRQLLRRPKRRRPGVHSRQQINNIVLFIQNALQLSHFCLQ